MPQNAGKQVTESFKFQNFQGGTCPWTPFAPQHTMLAMQPQFTSAAYSVQIRHLLYPLMTTLIFTCTSRAGQFRSRPFLNRCGFAVCTTSKLCRFENALLLKAYLKRHSSDNELDRHRVNERRNRIETDAVTNDTASV